MILMGPQNQTLELKAVAMLPCQATGPPPPVIRWYKDGRPLIGTDPRITILNSGTLQISGTLGRVLVENVRVLRLLPESAFLHLTFVKKKKKN